MTTADSFMTDQPNNTGSDAIVMQRHVMSLQGINVLSWPALTGHASLLAGLFILACDELLDEFRRRSRVLVCRISRRAIRRAEGPRGQVVAGLESQWSHRPRAAERVQTWSRRALVGALQELAILPLRLAGSR